MFQTNKFYPPSEDFKSAVKSVIDDILIDKIFDTIWKKTFHYITFFESFDGFSVGDAAIAHDHLTLTTQATTNDTATVVKQPDLQGRLTFSQSSRFASGFQADQITNQTVYLTIGGVVSGNEGYGFKIINGNLYGVTHDGTTENTILLQTISASTGYNIEARYIPSDKVIFLVNSIEKGVISSNLPIPDLTASVNLVNIRITANADAAKVLKISFWEYFQKRNVLK